MDLQVNVAQLLIVNKSLCEAVCIGLVILCYIVLLSLGGKPDSEQVGI